MVDKVAAVLLVPAEGDPLGLLADGAPVAFVGGAQKGIGGVYLPDRIQRRTDALVAFRPGWGYVCVYLDNGWWMLRAQPGDVALRLAWDGKPVPEGLDMLCRRMGWDVRPRGWSTVRAVLEWLAGPSPGTLVLLDARGREVKP